MWTVSRPVLNDVGADLDLILNIDSEEPLGTEAERDAVLELYALYEGLYGRPSEQLLGQELRADLLLAVHRGYDQVQEGRRLAKLRNVLKLATSECPYCGFGEIQDLDHHLQKAIYRALSIFPLNLVPVCATCNRLKPRVPSNEANKQLLNAYLEDPTSTDFFRADAKIDAESGGLVVTFRVVRPRGMRKELHDRLVAHVEQYRLNERLRPQVNNYLSAISTGLEDSWKEGNAAGVRDFLLRSAASNRARFGTNSWRTALLNGLAKCAKFCNGGFSVALGA